MHECLSAGAAVGGVGVPATLGDDGGSWSAAKISPRFLIAANWASPGVRNGALGWGLEMASVRLVAARRASSAGDETGTAQRCGKNSTVKLVRSARVVGM